MKSYPGPAVRRVMQREYGVFGKVECMRLAGISGVPIYNLRDYAVYRSQRAARASHPGAAGGHCRAATHRSSGRPAICGWTQSPRATTTAKPGCNTINASTSRYPMARWWSCVETISENT